MLAEALRNFKASVDAWSEAAYSRPRTVAATKRHSWRLAAGWALGCVLAFGCLAAACMSDFTRRSWRGLRDDSGTTKAAHERLAKVEKFDSREKALVKHAESEAPMQRQVQRTRTMICWQRSTPMFRARFLQQWNRWPS